jgi:hypothetical protein
MKEVAFKVFFRPANMPGWARVAGLLGAGWRCAHARRDRRYTEFSKIYGAKGLRTSRSTMSLSSTTVGLQVADREKYFRGIA